MNLAYGNIYIDNIDFSELYTTYADHKRLGVFVAKGLACVCCGLVGTQLIHSVDKGGHVHVDVYSANYILMNVDHIIPRSKGGSNTIENKQPMCEPCNTAKSNTLIGLIELKVLTFS